MNPWQTSRFVPFVVALVVQPSLVAAPDLAKNVRVVVDGNSISVEEAIRRAAADERLASYCQLRAAYGGTAEGQVELARWCRKQKLAEEEQLHWQSVLIMQPNQPDAIKALGLRKYQGQLLTKIQIEQAKKESKQAKEAERKWGPKLQQIKLALEQGDAAEREAALGELEAINDAHAMALVERTFSGANTDLALLVVEMYARAVKQQSTDALVRLAIHARDAAVREKAARELQYRPMESYMPSLIGALDAPIEISVTTDVKAGGPTYKWWDGYAYLADEAGRVRVVPGMYRMIRLSGNYTNKDVAFWVPETIPFSGWWYTGDRPDRHEYEFILSRDSPDPRAPYEYRGSLKAVEYRGEKGAGRASLDRSMTVLEERVREANTATAEMNLRVDAALREATKADRASGVPAKVEKADDVRPRLWWDWWQKKLNLNNYFAKGTEVWTQLGVIPIEQVLIGDRVLSKNSDTGELMFKLVIGIDARTDCAVRVLEVGSRTIVTTPDQPFFVPDDGWRNAEKLEPGTQLDSLAGAQRIENIRSGTADVTYSLLIAKLPNYFVDRQGILVHDATRP